MCNCVERWRAYDAARKAQDVSIGMFAIDDPAHRNRTHLMWEQYKRARDTCNTPGQHPHRSE